MVSGPQYWLRPKCPIHRLVARLQTMTLFLAPLYRTLGLCHLNESLWGTLDWLWGPIQWLQYLEYIIYFVSYINVSAIEKKKWYELCLYNKYIHNEISVLKTGFVSNIFSAIKCGFGPQSNLVTCGSRGDKDNTGLILQIVNSKLWIQNLGIQNCEFKIVKGGDNDVQLGQQVYSWPCEGNATVLQWQICRQVGILTKNPDVECNGYLETLTKLCHIDRFQSPSATRQQ